MQQIIPTGLLAPDNNDLFKELNGITIPTITTNVQNKTGLLASGNNDLSKELIEATRPIIATNIQKPTGLLTSDKNDVRGANKPESSLLSHDLINPITNELMDADEVIYFLEQEERRNASLLGSLMSSDMEDCTFYTPTPHMLMLFENLRAIFPMDYNFSDSQTCRIISLALSDVSLLNNVGVGSRDTDFTLEIFNGELGPLLSNAHIHILLGLVEGLKMEVFANFSQIIGTDEFYVVLGITESALMVKGFPNDRKSASESLESSIINKGTSLV